MNLSEITVVFMLDGVTHSGLISTDGTAVCVCESCVLPFTRAAGGLTPARSMIASVAAACASR